ncbi:reverse transcriptase [Tanacetum coccineum]
MMVMYCYMLKGLHSTILSNRDKTEVVNKCVETYSRCMTIARPNERMKWLSLAEYWYNSNFHNSINTTPFEVLYGPPAKWTWGDRTLQAREQTIAMPNEEDANWELLTDLEKRIGNVTSPTAQVHLVFHVSQLKNYHSKDVAIGNFPLCDAQGLIAATPHKHLDRKLAKQGNRVVVYGLIQWSNSSEEDANWELLTDLEKRIRNVASPTAHVHLVFHVSQLKKCHSKDVAMGNFPLCDAQGLIAATPHKHLDRKLAKQGNRVVVYGLIQWSNSCEEDANWELLTDLKKRKEGKILAREVQVQSLKLKLVT